MTAHCGRCFRDDVQLGPAGRFQTHLTGCRRGQCTNHAACPHKAPCQGARLTPQETYGSAPAAASV